MTLAITRLRCRSRCWRTRSFSGLRATCLGPTSHDPRGAPTAELALRASRATAAPAPSASRRRRRLCLRALGLVLRETQDQPTPQALLDVPSEVWGDRLSAAGQALSAALGPAAAALVLQCQSPPLTEETSCLTRISPRCRRKSSSAGYGPESCRLNQRQQTACKHTAQRSTASCGRLDTRKRWSRTSPSCAISHCVMTRTCLSRG